MICSHRKSLELCKASYLSETEIEEQVSQEGDIGKIIGANGPATFFGSNPVAGNFRDVAIAVPTTSGLMLCFRGTIASADKDTAGKKLTSFLDWLNDANLDDQNSNQYPPRVHGGFAEATNQLWDMENGIRQWLHEQMAAASDPKRIIITGHSKGGAMAYLAAWKISQDNLLAGCTIDIISFAAARPGTQDFANSLAPKVNTIARYEYAKDIVPLLPPKTMLPGIKLLLEGIGITLPAGSLGFQGVGQRIPAETIKLPGRLAYLTDWLFNGGDLSPIDFNKISWNHGIDPGQAYDGIVCQRDVNDCGHH